MIYSFKATGDFAPTFVSENIEDWLGYEPREYLEEPEFWRSCVHPDDLAAVEAASVHLFKKGRHTVEYRFLKKDGTYCWVNDAQRLVRDERWPAGRGGRLMERHQRAQAGGGSDSGSSSPDRAPARQLAGGDLQLQGRPATMRRPSSARTSRTFSATTARNTSTVRISGAAASTPGTCRGSRRTMRGCSTRGVSLTSTASGRRTAAIAGSATSCSCSATRRANRSRWSARGTTSPPASRSARPWSPHRIVSGACCRLRRR